MPRPWRLGLRCFSLRVINSPQVCATPEAAALLNARRNEQLAAYCADLRRRQRAYALEAQQLPTRAQRVLQERAVRREQRNAQWPAQVAAFVARLDLPRRGASVRSESRSARAGRAESRVPNAEPQTTNAESQPTGTESQSTCSEPRERVSLARDALMRRKYLHYLAAQVLPGLVTRDNLDARVLAAVEAPQAPNEPVDLAHVAREVLAELGLSLPDDAQP